MIALGGNNDEGVLMVIALLVGLWSPEIQFPITFPIALRHFYNRDHLRPFHSFLKPNSPFNPPSSSSFVYLQLRLEIETELSRRILMFKLSHVADYWSETQGKGLF